MASEEAVSSGPTTVSKKKSIREPKSTTMGAVGDSSDAAAPLIATKSHKEMKHKSTKKSVASLGGQESEGGADGQKKMASRRRSQKKIIKGDDPTGELAEDGSESNTSAPITQFSSKATGRKSTSSRSSRKAHAPGVQDSDTIGKSAKDQILSPQVQDQRTIEVKQVASGAKQEMLPFDMSWPSRLQLTALMEERTLDNLEALGGVEGLCSRLGVNPQTGLHEPIPDFQERLKHFGENRFEEKKSTPFWKFIWEQLAQKIIILLLSMATLEIIVKSIVGDSVERVEAIGESSMLYVTVAIIVFIAAFLDWKRERMFEALTKLLAASNIRFVIRDGRLLEVTDEQICVGDVMSFNSHMAAIISCDGILLSGQGVKTDESALTGEPEPMPKDSERPFMISGTTVCSGSGSMLVVAVGDHSISGKIKKDVYGAAAGEASPLYAKLDTMANNIGKAGTLGALIAMIALLVNEYGIRQSTNYKKLMDIFLTTLGILACAIPEGLPLALVIALALTSNKMTRENNLVKSLNSCETMGSATTICTDKTGTLTTNRMTVRGAYIAGVSVRPQGCLSVGPEVASENKIDDETKTLVGNLICVCTMDESGFTYKEPSPGAQLVCQFQGNPTECALLKMADEMSFDYRRIRNEVAGRSPDTLDRGCSKSFSSARKMMSWTVQNPAGGYRVYAKGASEIIVSRATMVNLRGAIQPLGTAEVAEVNEVISNFADMAMRTIGLAYKDIDRITYDELDETVLNSDGSPAFSCEVNLTLLAVVGIEDPLRPEVAPAIARCYNAGIDVRMVTGDNLQTAIAIAKGAGILDLSLHCDKMGSPLPKRAMEGKTFRNMVHDYNIEAIPVFNQEKFDEVWPYLRVLARSSPDDKLTLAKGLNSSLIYKDEKKCKELLDKERIVIFPDRQVVAMTGDGTNDAPALKASDVGFAMGIAGTQIAKDAAKIILLDDNFASIVIAAKWGRNVYDSVQKFLQFQLTANASILCLNIFCAVSDMPSPMTVLHLLWLNLIMDSFASIAFASEPASDALLDRPPVNRGKSIITSRMLFNICGASVYNLVVVITFMCVYDWVPELVPNAGDPVTAAKSRHYTMLFNMFIFLQVFNEYNSRFLYDTPALWRGLDKNPIYLLISFGTITFQVVMVQLAAPILTHPLKIHKDGLTFLQWVICLAAGAGTLINQQLMNGVRALVNVCLPTRSGEAR